MALSFRGKSKRIKYVGEMRKSKIATSAGCGSLVDLPGFSGIMGGQNLWKQPFEHMKIYEKNLEIALGKEYFVQVSPNQDKQDFKNAYELPIIRFPEYYYCPGCHELDYASKIGKNYKNDKNHVEPLKCNNCNKELIPSRFIMACPNGHIADFPYKYWAHKNEKEGICDNPKLQLKYIGKTSGLESIVISCETCGASNSMADCLSKDSFSYMKCQGGRPWLGWDDKDVKEQDCDKKVRALMRGSTNVYYPENASALTIPPWSNDIQRELNQHYDKYKTLAGLDEAYREKEIIKHFYNDHYDERFQCTEQEFVNQVLDRFNVDYNDVEKIDTDNIPYMEYKALIGTDKDDSYFKTEKTYIDEDLKCFFKQIKLVKRLREVQVLKSFRRVTIDPNEGYSAALSTKNEKWLPAVELLGEGLFFEFKKDKIEEWKCKNLNRYYKMKKRFHAITSGNESVSEEFVMIHTFSHLFIRELSFVSGYDTSSIKEKIYVNPTEEKYMAGLLIYTTSASSDGSLGGLVRQGYNDKLKDIIESMLAKAEWCSNDPICIESTAQGKDSLNYAACHACTLLGETSCINNNILLDRNSIVGNMFEDIVGYFSE